MADGTNFEVDFNDTLRHIDLGEYVDYLPPQEISTDFFLAAASGLAYVRTNGQHDPYPRYWRHANLYGEKNYGLGRVARAVYAAAAHDGSSPIEPFRALQEAAAHLFDGPNAPQIEYPTPVARIESDVLWVDDTAIDLSRPPAVVVELGTNLGSRAHLNSQAEAEEPFRFIPVGATYFIGRVLQLAYDRIHGPGSSEQALRDGILVPHTDGVVVAVSKFLESGLQADLIIVDHPQADWRHVEFVMPNLHKLLREGGKLILRSYHMYDRTGCGAHSMKANAESQGSSNYTDERYIKSILKTNVHPHVIHNFVLTK